MIRLPYPWNYFRLPQWSQSTSVKDRQADERRRHSQSNMALARTCFAR